MDAKYVELYALRAKFKDFQNWKGDAVRRGKDVCRRYCDHDKVKGAAMFERLQRHYAKTPSAQPEDETEAQAYSHVQDLIAYSEECKRREAFFLKKMVAIAKTLPCASWATSVEGIGMPSFAELIGETYDLNNFPHWRKLWRYLGLAVNESTGKAERGEVGKKLPYAPRRKALVLGIMADCIIRAKGTNKYLAYYNSEKQRYLSEGKGSSAGHRNKMAKRRMMKLFIRDLWCNWTGRRLGAGHHWNEGYPASEAPKRSSLDEALATG